MACLALALEADWSQVCEIPSTGPPDHMELWLCKRDGRNKTQDPISESINSTLNCLTVQKSKHFNAHQEGMK